MVQRNVSVRFTAEIQNYKAAMEAAAAATEKTKRAAEDAGEASEESNKKSSESAKLTAAEIAGLAAAHKDAAAASGLQYSAAGQLVDMNGKALSSQQAAAHGLASFSAETYLAAQALGEAAASTEEADSTLQQLIASATESSDAWETAGSALVAFGGASVAGLGLAAKAAMDWESAWAGVTKTVDGSPEQMAALEGELRGLAKVLPSTHEDIAAVAEAAGQLGVKREDVVGFTKTMIELGDTTNLTADEAATSIAQISNVMGTMERDGSKGVERFAATLVALGNAGASTEAEILDMAQRLAGAGKLIGASESDVLAMANAMASVGIESQLGGGVMSRVMQRMYGDVKTGGKGLEDLAKVAGTTSKDFAHAFETDPVRAVDMMVKGLARVKDEGGNVMDTMTGIGIKGTEETSVILRLAGAGDLLSDSLKLGDAAWASNSALANEAAKRYETTESKVKIAWNNIKDAAIDAGAVLLPIISGMAEGAAGIAQAYGNLPAPVKGAITALGSVVGVAALGAGAFLSLTPRIADTMAAFNRLAPAGGRARAGVLGASKVAAGAAAAYMALATAAALAAEATSKDRKKTSVEEFNNALVGTAQKGAAAEKALDGVFKGIVKVAPDSGVSRATNDFADVLDRIYHTSPTDSIQDFRDTLFGQNALSGINAAKDAVGNYDKSLASMAQSGNFKDAAAGFELAAKKAKDNGDSIETLLPLFPAYKEAILANKTANGETQVSQEALIDAMLKGGTAADGAAKGVAAVGEAGSTAIPITEGMAKALEEIGLSADGTVVNLDKFTQALINAGLLTLNSRDATAKFEEGLDGLKGKIDEIMLTEQAHGGVLNENRTDLDLMSEAGRAANGVLADMTQKGLGAAEAMAKNGESQQSVQGQLDKTYEAMVQTAEGFGLSEEAAIALTREILHVPPGVDVKSWMSDEAKRMAEATTGAVEGIPKSATITVYGNVDPSFRAAAEEAYRLGQIRSAPGANVNVSAGGVEDMGLFMGGRVPGYAGGGQLPTTGPGTATTDGFLGISSSGVPLVRVDAGEWIINEQSSRKYDGVLAAINAGTYKAYADGGRVGAAYVPARQMSMAGATTVTAPQVSVFIGNEQIDARIEVVAGSVTDSKLSNVATMAGGRR